VEVETCKRELLIQIPSEVVQKESENVAADYARKVRVPGFRPGRVPRDLILQRFRKAIREEVAETLLPKFFRDTAKEQNLPVVGNPKFADVKFEDNQPLTCIATFEVYPSVEIGQYKGLEISQDEPRVTDEDVDQAIEKLRENAATFEVAEERAAEDGDLLTVAYEGRALSQPGAVLVQVKEGTVRLGAEGTLKQFSDGLRGARAGDVREFEVAYPGDFGQADVAGKTVKFRVEVLAVKRKVLPPLDDELGKTLGSEETLEGLRSSLRKNLQEMREREASAEAKRKLLDALIASGNFPVPEVLVEEQMDQKVRQIAGRLVDQGVDPGKANIDWSKTRRELRSVAERDVRGNLILRKVAETEKIEISDEEIDQAVRDLAAGGNESPAALKTRLTRNGGLARLQSSRLNQKALDFIYHNATVVRQLRLV
jgi:trigger factor